MKSLIKLIYYLIYIICADDNLLSAYSKTSVTPPPFIEVLPGLSSLGLLLPNFILFDFPVFLFSAYLMNVIPVTYLMNVIPVTYLMNVIPET